MDQSTNAPALHDGYAKMTPLCTTSLRESFDPSRQLFSRQLLDGRWCAVDDVYPHETLTSTSIALVGIARAGFDPADHGVEVGRCITAIAGEIRRTDYLGGIGLALWANAVSGNSWSASHLLGEVGLDLEAFIDRVLPTLTTMEVAWAASGLLHELHRCGDGRVRDAAKACVAELVTMRFSARTGLMNHAGRQASLSHRARSHIANFADQIYSVQALAFASLAVGDQTALAIATRLADTHVSLQGDLGQWWWHFNARRGVVALRYSVYSVHQHGMAPMALLAVQRAGGPDYSAAIERSVGWIDHNESGESMIDQSRSTIWRNLDPPSPGPLAPLRGIAETVGRSDSRTPDAVRVNRETRPYEWAWCLYAAAMHGPAESGSALA